MAVFPQKPRSGQKVLQGLYNSVCQIIDYLPSLEVRGDNSSTSVTKTSNGTIVHSNNGFDSIEDLRARYRFHNGIMAEDNKIYIRSTLTGGRFITVDYYEQNEQGEEVELDYPLINCTLSAGNNIEITPNGVINCTLTGGGGGGGGNTYYADNFTLSTTTSGGNTFCLYDVYSLITGGGGTTVSRYGDAPGYPGHALGTIISSPNYVGVSGISILDDETPGTYNKYVAITADFDYHAGTGISIDPDTRTINCTVEPGGGGEIYYADETTIKLSSNNTFYLYDVEPALTGEGDIQIGNYGFDGVRRITSISATPYTGTDGIGVQNHVISLTATIPTKTSDLINDSGFITSSNEYKGDGITIAASGTNNNTFYVIDGVFARLSTVVNLSTELSGHIDYVSAAIPLSTSQLVNDVPFVTSTWVDDNFISGGATGDHMYYNSQEKRLKCMLTGGTNIEIEDVGNYGYINCTLTGLDQLDNTCGFVTTEQVTSIVPHIPTSGLMSTALYDANDNLTGIEYGLSTKFYNDLTTISTRPATGDKILSSHNGTLSWETNIAGSNIPTPTANKVLSSNASNQIVWATNTGGSTPTPGEQNYNYIFSSGIYQATAGSKWIVRYPHIPIAWSEYEEGPWPEGWQPPKEPGSDAYFSQQWPLYQYYYDQPTEPALPCGFLCSLYTWAPGEYGSSKSHGHWDIILKLPNVSERTVVEVVNYTDTALIVVTDNQKQIIPQCFNNTIGDDQNYWSTNYPNYAYSFKHGDFNACCKIIFYYDPAPPYTPERTPYASGAMKQLTSGGCWFGQILY